MIPLPPLSELPVFAGVSRAQLAALALLYFAAFFVKGALGIGSLTPAVVLGALIVDPHRAVLLALVANVLSQVQFILPGLRDGDWTIVRRVIFANFAGAAVGIWIFGRVDAAELALILGITLGGIVGADMARLFDRLRDRAELARPGTMLVLSALSGLISGVTGAGGLLFLALYLRLVLPDKRRLRGTILLLGTLVVGWRAVVMAASGILDHVVALEALLLLPAVVLGGMAGTGLYRHISEARFGFFLRIVILLGALALIARGLRQILGLTA